MMQCAPLMVYGSASRSPQFGQYEQAKDCGRCKTRKMEKRYLSSGVTIPIRRDLVYPPPYKWSLVHRGGVCVRVHCLLAAVALRNGWAVGKAIDNNRTRLWREAKKILVRIWVHPFTIYFKSRGPCAGRDRL